MVEAKGFHSSDDATQYRTNASFVSSDEFTRPVLSLLDPRPGEVILDLGCGTGELTTRLARLVCQVDPHTGIKGQVLAIDASQGMLDAFATTLKTEVKGEGEDAIEGLSMDNAALHWMKRDPAAVIRGVHTLLKPGGIFAAEMGGHLNMIGVRGALHAALTRRGHDAKSFDPWIFPTASSYRSMLEKAGFDVESIELVPRITPLGKGGIEGWLRNFGGSFFCALPTEAERSSMLEEVIQELRPDMFDEETGTWTVMYVRLRFKAVRK